MNLSLIQPVPSLDFMTLPFYIASVYKHLNSVVYSEGKMLQSSKSSPLFFFSTVEDQILKT